MSQVFAVLGDKSAQDIIAASKGAQSIELRIPFSDACADTEDVIVACHNALAKHTTIAQALDDLRTIAKALPQARITLSTYANNALAFNLDMFCKRAAEAGVSDIFFVDVPRCMLNTVIKFEETVNKYGMQVLSKESEASALSA